MIDVAILLLNCSAKDFKNCYFLKISASGVNNALYEQRDNRRQRGVLNPMHVQQLLDMGMPVSRERIV